MEQQLLLCSSESCPGLTSTLVRRYRSRDQEMIVSEGHFSRTKILGRHKGENYRTATLHLSHKSLYSPVSHFFPSFHTTDDQEHTIVIQYYNLLRNHTQTHTHEFIGQSLPDEDVRTKGDNPSKEIQSQSQSNCHY